MNINLKALQAAQDTLGRRWLLTFESELESELQNQIWATKRRTLALLAVFATALLVVFTISQREVLLGHGVAYLTKLRFFVFMPLSLALAVVCMQSRSLPALRLAHLLLLAALGIAIAWMQTTLRAAGVTPPFAIFLLFVAFAYMLTAASLALSCVVALSGTAAYALFAVWLAQPVTVDHWTALVFANVLGFAGGRVHEKTMRGMFLAERIAVLVSLQDPLTGLANRRAGLDHLERALRHSRREQLPISVMMIDVDYFKLYNDHYGHIAGDDALTGGRCNPRPCAPPARCGLPLWRRRISGGALRARCQGRRPLCRALPGGGGALQDRARSLAVRGDHRQHRRLPGRKYRADQAPEPR